MENKQFQITQRSRLLNEKVLMFQRAQKEGNKYKRDGSYEEILDDIIEYCYDILWKKYPTFIRHRNFKEDMIQEVKIEIFLRCFD